MTYGKEYRVLNNFKELDDEAIFEDKLMNLCKEDKAILFINGKEIEFKEE